MITSGPMSRFSVRPGLFDQASWIFCPGSSRLFAAFSSATGHSSSSRCQLPPKSDDGVKMLKGSSSRGNVGSQFLGSFAKKVGLMKVKESVSSLYVMSFRSFIHSGSPKEVEMERNSRSMNFVRGLVQQNGENFVSGSQFGRFGVEQNADIVHIKMIRNNTFVTVTDSKGNKKAGASSGCLTEMKGGPKVSRYAAEATAEHVGRLARNMGLKSVVMKVNGYTYFKKKKQAILSFREGYTHSRGDLNPIVYIEDTTQRPHNGCRLPKKRRV